MTVMQEGVVCPICKGTDFSVRFEAAPLDYCVARAFPIAACMGCGHGITVGANEVESAELYEQGNYDAREGGLRKVLRPLLDGLERNKARALQHWVAKGSVFEIGTGKGRFLLAARQAGFEVGGIEPSCRSLAFARATLGDVVSGETLNEHVNRSARLHAAVCMWHVLEHIPEPSAVLADVRRLLQQQGVLMVAVPNFASLQSRYGRANWYHLDPPRHVNHFTPGGLCSLMKTAGFEVLQVDYMSFFQNWVGDIVTLLNRLSPGKNALLNLLKMNRQFFATVGPLPAVLNILWNAILLPVLLLPSLLLTLFSQACQMPGTIVVYARMTDLPR
jgi:SAM-dependent methyltransferase